MDLDSLKYAMFVAAAVAIGAVVAALGRWLLKPTAPNIIGLALVAAVGSMWFYHYMRRKLDE